MTTYADALNLPATSLEVLSQRSIAPIMWGNIGNEHSPRRNRMDQLQRKRLPGRNKTMEVAVKEPKKDQRDGPRRDKLKARGHNRIDQSIE